MAQQQNLNHLFKTKETEAIQRGLTVTLLRVDAGRELGMRRSLYPKWVAGGKKSITEAKHAHACQDALYKILKHLEDHEIRAELDALIQGAGELAKLTSSEAT
tara:strand:- start:1029 stop:1337 length:309 start_codon:yes stop_codon:yes gene_type:complete